VSSTKRDVPGSACLTASRSTALKFGISDRASAAGRARSSRAMSLPRPPAHPADQELHEAEHGDQEARVVRADPLVVGRLDRLPGDAAPQVERRQQVLDVHHPEPPRPLLLLGRGHQRVGARAVAAAGVDDEEDDLGRGVVHAGSILRAACHRAMTGR
jgi:hypothetical protein